MYTYTFERESKIGYELCKFSCYGYEYYIDNEFESTGLVEDVEELVQAFLNDGWEEIK